LGAGCPGRDNRHRRRRVSRRTCVQRGETYGPVLSPAGHEKTRSRRRLAFLPGRGQAHSLEKEANTPTGHEKRNSPDHGRKKGSRCRGRGKKKRAWEKEEESLSNNRRKEMEVKAIEQPAGNRKAGGKGGTTGHRKRGTAKKGLWSEGAKGRNGEGKPEKMPQREDRRRKGRPPRSLNRRTGREGTKIR